MCSAKKNKYSETCVREPPLRLTSVVDVERWLSYKGTCHVILLAKLHDMYLYKTATFLHEHSLFKVCLKGGSLTQVPLFDLFQAILAFVEVTTQPLTLHFETAGRQVWTITKTCLYNFDPLKPHFYIVKLGFTGVYINFLISAQNIDCGYSLETPQRGGSNEYPQSMFWAELWKMS